MSWESTLVYYRLINQEVAARLGGLHSARLVMSSVDFHDVEILQRRDDWDEAGRLLGEEARRLERAGAEAVVLCTNTMHRVADAVAAAVSIPLLHILDATAAAIRTATIDAVGLLGTRFTMEQDFYRRRLEASGVSVLVPEAAERAEIHRVIYDELCRGVISPASRQAYLGVIAALRDRGARGIVLGCTEISLLLAPQDCPLPAFDTTALHARAAVDFALDTERRG